MGTFNILTGEGEGRECEFRRIGMKAVFGEHAKDSTNRIKNSQHRFFQHDAQPKFERMKNQFEEGLVTTKRETAILGYGSSGVSRSRTRSVGAADNFSHTKGPHKEPDWETPHYGNRSQIILG